MQHWTRGTLAALALAAALPGASLGQEVAAVGTTVAASITTFGDPPRYADGFAHLDYVNPAAPKGGEIALSAPGTFDSFNPYSVEGVAAALASIGHERLMDGTADEVGALYCLLCQSLEYPADKAWVVFALRPEARFAEGSPVTAEDVVFTYKLFIAQGLPSYSAVMQQFIAGVEALDAAHVKFTFKPDSKLRERIQAAGGTPVLSKAWFEKTGARLDKSGMEPALGSGPYQLERFDIGKRVVYKRNPDYWGKDLPLNVGRYNFDRIRVEYFGDSTAALEGFKAGEYTFRNENSAKNWATAYDFPGLKNGWVVREELADGAIGSGQAFVMNLRRPQFQDIRVREALGLMFNFEWANKSLFYDLYARTTSIWDNSAMAATGTPGPEELALLEPFADLLPRGVLTEPAVLPPVSGERQLDRGNLRKASALLDAAGWAVGDDGMRRDGAGQTLRIEILTADPAFDRVINPYVENLRAAGVDARLSRVDPAQYEARTRKFDFDMVTDSLGQPPEPGAELQQYFGTAGVKDVFNLAGISDPVVDGLITEIMKADSRATLAVRVHALDRVLRAMRFWVPQWFKNRHTVAYYDMFEHPDPLPPYALGQLDFWWYNAEKADGLRAAGALR